MLLLSNHPFFFLNMIFLIGNKIGGGAFSIGSSLRCNQTLKTLILWSVPICFFPQVVAIHQIWFQRFIDNQIDTSSGFRILQALNGNTGLTHLNLAGLLEHKAFLFIDPEHHLFFKIGNFLKDDANVFQQALTSNNSLTWLDLRGKLRLCHSHLVSFVSFFCFSLRKPYWRQWRK